MAKINTRRPTIEQLEQEAATWPPPLRRAWIDAHDPNWGTLSWAPQTRYTCARVFSRYLSSIAADQLEVGRCLLQPVHLRHFLKQSEKSASLRTLHGYTHQLLQVAKVLYRHELCSGELGWLRQTRQRLHQTAEQTPKQRRDRIVSAFDLLWVAQAAVQEAGSLTGWPACQRFRDGLFLIVGLMMPERRRALCTLRFDQVDLADGRVHFDAGQMKSKAARTWVLEPKAVDLLREWITVWRAAHVQPGEDLLFIARGGKGVGADAMYEAMRKLTRAKLGRPVTPHLLRHAAATTLLEQEPGKPGLVSLLLGHRSTLTRAEYTERAKALIASRAASAALASAAEQAARATRRDTRSRLGCLQRRPSRSGQLNG